MGIFNKMNDWLTKTSGRIIAGNGEAGTQNSAYGTENQGMNSVPEEAKPVSPQNAIDPFKRNGEGEYGGRQVYRSRYEMEREGMQPQPAEQMRTQQIPPQQMPQQHMPQPPQQGYAQNAAPNNVLPFPGMRQGTDGMVYGHVEYILFLHSCGQCRRVIDYIKTNASVFLNMEFIASEAERQRCVDFLSGAVYALGCTLNKISPRGIYLISAPTVKVILDPYAQKMGKVPETRGFVQQRYEQSAARPAAESPSQREPMPRQFDRIQPTQMPRQDYGSQPVQEESMNQAGTFTQRFAAQGTQRNRPVTFAAAMGGGFQNNRYPQ